MIVVFADMGHRMGHRTKCRRINGLSHDLNYACRILMRILNQFINNKSFSVQIRRLICILLEVLDCIKMPILFIPGKGD